MVVRKLNEPEITEQKSLRLTRNLLHIAISKISYVRGLFPENYFNDKSVPALGMKIKILMPIDAESRRLIDWMEKGVYDALQKKYLKTLLFCISEAIEGPSIEEYAFSFSYSNSGSEEVVMNISRAGNKKQGATFKSTGNKDIKPNQMRSSACKMIRTLVQWMQTLDCMPEERTILMKLLYHEDVTPIDYEPPFFRGCSEQEVNCPWLKNPLKMEIGNVNGKHFVLALKVKSILDPCQDENNDMEDDEEISLGVDSTPATDPSNSDSEALTEEIMDKLVKKNILSRTGKDSYSISKLKKCNEEIVMKEEMGVQVKQDGEKVQRGNNEDYIYMKALYHVLPLAYVTISELQSKLEGEADQALVRKLLNKMTCDGYVEAESNPELGNRVIRSEFTVKKLIELMEIFEPQNISTCACGGLCCVGSDLTRTLEISVDPHLNGLSRIQEQLGNNTRLRRNETAASRENAIPWSNKRNGVDGRGFTKYVEHDKTSCSRLSQEKHTSKTSTVEEHIHQNMKLCNKVSEIGHGTTGFAFINPERIIMVTDGKVTGKKLGFYFVCPRVSCKRRRIKRRRMCGYWKYGWVPYVRLNSRKIFVVGKYPNQILISCAGLTYWYKMIVDDLKIRVENDEILTPEICAGIASETMDVDANYVDETLRPDAPSIHEAYAEMFFGGFIGEGPQRRLSLFLCIKNEFAEIIESSRIPEFTEEELDNMGVSFMGIGTGGETASRVLAGHQEGLNQVGLPGAHYTNKVLDAMQNAIVEDKDSGGMVTVAQMTQESVQFEYFDYDGYPSIPIF